MSVMLSPLKRGKKNMLKEQLSNHLAQFASAPFLVVGSGLSRRYLGLEDWPGLLRKFAALCGRSFEYYQSKCDSDYPQMGSILAEDFHDFWWNSPVYKPRHSEYASALIKRDSPLKIEVAEYMKERALARPSDPALIREIELLSKATIDGVITTNYDQFLESIFQDYEVYVSQENLLFSHTQSIAEIYKIHGCVSDPNSIVLTRDDYKIFHERKAYLAAKLLTIFVEHPVIFLGYSLTDENINAILESIVVCLSDTQIEQLSNRLIVVQWDREGKGDEFHANTPLLLRRKILPVTIIKAKSFAPIYEALGTIERKFPAQLLRRLKEHLYKLVLSNDQNQQMHVLDINNNSLLNDVKVVFGVGSLTDKIGYKALSAADVLRDMIFDKNQYDAKQIVSHSLPELLKQSRQNLPVFYHLSRAGLLSSTGSLLPEARVDERILNRTKATFADFRNNAYKDKAQFLSKTKIAEIIEKNDVKHAIIYIPLLRKDNIDLVLLRDFLRKHAEECLAQQPQTDFRKLVCLYDWLTAQSSG